MTGEGTDNGAEGWTFERWWAENREDLNIGRRMRYRRDSSYRDRVLSNNKESRDRKREERTAKRRAEGVVKSAPSRDVPFKTVKQGNLTLYTIGKLAMACDRSIQTIRGWEKKGYIDDTPHRTPRGDRLYSQKQIDDTVKKLKAEGRLKEVARPSIRTTYRVKWPNGKVEETELYQVGVLADACERAIVTLDQMSKKGALPDTPLTFGAIKRRLYTGQMIQIVREAFIAHGGEIRGPEAQQSFCEAVLAGWEKLGVMGAKVLDD